MYFSDSDTKEETEDSDGSKVEVQQSIIQRAEEQAVAETIVFSLVQRLHHPNFENHLIPTILIDSSLFRIIMYDAVNDVLLCSPKIPIFA